MSELLKAAATVIVIRDRNDGIEVLMLQRSSNASFLPGCWVFPGGAIDPEDHPGGNEIERAIVAACREANEEAGLMLNHTTLVTFSHWTAPINFPRRFSTWFFITIVTDNPSIAIDDEEIQDHQWLTPSTAIELHYQGNLPILPPTFRSLLELETANNSSELVDRHKQKEPSKYFPKIVSQGDKKVFLYENDSGYAAGDASLKDTQDRITMEDNIIRYHTD